MTRPRAHSWTVCVLAIAAWSAMPSSVADSRAASDNLSKSSKLVTLAAAQFPNLTKAERALLDDAVSGTNPAIGEIDSRSVVGNCAAVEKIPGFAIGVARPAADEPCVKEIKTLVGRPFDLAV